MFLIVRFIAFILLDVPYEPEDLIGLVSDVKRALSADFLIFRRRPFSILLLLCFHTLTPLQ